MLPRAFLAPVFLSLLSLSVLLATGCGGAASREAKHLKKGEAYLADGNFEKARVELQNVLQIAPKDAAARFDMGVVDEKLNNPREAAQFYQGTIDIDPQHVGARTNLGRLYLLSGAPGRALELIGPALETHPDDADLLSIRAAARLQQKDLSGAQADAERAVQLSPTNANAVAVLAGIYTSTGAKDKALTLLEQSIQKIPDTVDLRLVLAQLYSQDNRVAETEALLLKLVELRPAEKAHRLRLVQYYARLGQVDAAEKTLRQAVKDLPAERDVKLALVDFLAARRSRDAAEKELKEMVAAAPTDNELKFALARFYENGRQSALAEGIYQGVIDREQTNPAGLSARNRLAGLRAQRGDVAGALKLANEVLEQSPRDDDALLMRGNIALAKQDPRSAIADLRAVLRDQPNAVGVLRILARAHLANGEPAVAEETMRHAVEANPNDPALRLDFAELLVQLGKAEQAKPMLADLVKQHPDNLAALGAQFRVSVATNDLVTAKSAAEGIVATQPKAATGYFYEGMIAETEKHNDEALRLYAKAVDTQPDALEPLQAEMRLLVASNRGDEAFKRADELATRYPAIALGPEAKGELLLGKGRPAEAQSAFNEAIARSPKWWPPYRGLASSLMAAKNPNGAIDILRKAVAVVDQPEQVRTELGSLLEATGNPDAAIKEYEAILVQNPQSDIATNNLAMLLATYKKDTVSLDRAKTLSARFAESANPSFLDTYGWVLYKRGETAASVPVLQRVVAKLPNEPIARYHLGMAQSQLGSNTEARDNLTRAVNSGAKFAGLDEAKAMLDRIAKPPASAAITPKS
jgi:tetratricopeptide (TPR) repeat protein